MYKYGATNPAEFFAVATETFFEKPVEMQQRHSELFELLLKFWDEKSDIKWNGFL